MSEWCWLQPLKNTSNDELYIVTWVVKEYKQWWALHSHMSVKNQLNTHICVGKSYVCVGKSLFLHIRKVKRYVGKCL